MPHFPDPVATAKRCIHHSLIGDRAGLARLAGLPETGAEEIRPNRQQILQPLLGPNSSADFEKTDSAGQAFPADHQIEASLVQGLQRKILFFTPKNRR